MKLTQEDARHVLEHGKKSVNNNREYRHYGGVCYPVAALVWASETGEWPAKTPRHLDNNPLNNTFENLRPPGRAPYKRKAKTPSEPKVRNSIPPPAPAQTGAPTSLFR